MRIAASHRRRGDEVHRVDIRKPGAAIPETLNAFDKVYASLIFESTRPVAEAIRTARPDAIIGGTGAWPDLQYRTIEELGLGDSGVDYSIYPDFRDSIGFSQRGCRLKCDFCVVPKKEGPVQETDSIMGIWRGDPYPRNILLLDNDFFGQPSWRDKIDEARRGRFKVCFTQGINARFLDEESAAAIASVDYRDGRFKERRIYTAWDNRRDEERLFRGLEALKKHGVRPQAIMVYILIGYWKRCPICDRELSAETSRCPAHLAELQAESHEARDYRRQRLREFGARPYPMPFMRTRELVGFQRWCIGGYDKWIPWDRWLEANYDPRKAAKAWAHERRMNLDDPDLLRFLYGDAMLPFVNG